MAEKKDKRYVSDNARFMAEWDWDKNNALGLSPNRITFGSTKKVYWKCDKGHSWYVSPNSRRNSGCPICNIERHTSFPEQALLFYVRKYWYAESRYKLNRKELDVFIPELQIGIEYDGEYYHRSEKAKMREKNKDGFFASQGIKIIRIKELANEGFFVENSFYFYFPDDMYKNLEYVLIRLFLDLGVISNDIDVNIERDRATILEQFAQIEKECCISQARPDLAAEWDYESNHNLRPEQINIYSKLKVHWICSKGHRWSAAVYSRAAGNGCPHCSGKILTIGENDLKSQNPELCEEWDYKLNHNLCPEQITVNNGRKVWWKCRVCGHSWMSTVAHRNNGRGCPICSQALATKKINKTKIQSNGSLKSAYPNIANEWNYERNSGLLPQNFTPRSGQKVWWKCSICGNEWEAYISNRTKGSGCPECAKRQRIKTSTQSRIQEVGSLANIFPSIAAEWHYERNGELTPSLVSPGSSRKVWWKCLQCGHEWEATINNRSKGRCCPECAKQKRKKSK